VKYLFFVVRAFGRFQLYFQHSFVPGFRAQASVCHEVLQWD
jgi:hypothetical protein